MEQRNWLPDHLFFFRPWKNEKNMIANYESVKERLFKGCWKAVIKSQCNSQVEYQQVKIIII